MFLKGSAPPATRRTARRAIAVAACLGGLLVPAQAQAAPGIDVTPSVANGSQVALGDVAQGQLVLANHSSAPEDGGYLTVSDLTLVPSCGAELADRNCVLSPGPDRGTITVGDSATGSGACTGNSFAVTDADPVSGKVTFTPDIPIILGAAGPGATCVVSFTYTVNRFPTKDSSSEEDGLQTDLVAFTRAIASWNGLQAPDLGYATVTVVRDTPDLTVTAPPTIQVGGRLSATATLAGSHPDGSLTFDLFGTADPDCAGAPVATSTVAVSGNGTFQSPAVVASAAGTYRWKASYGGDEDNEAVSSDCSAADAATEAVAEEPTSPRGGRRGARTGRPPAARRIRPDAQDVRPRVSRNGTGRRGRERSGAQEGQGGQGNDDQVHAVAAGERHDPRPARHVGPTVRDEVRQGDQEAQAQEALRALRQGLDAQARAPQRRREEGAVQRPCRAQGAAGGPLPPAGSSVGRRGHDERHPQRDVQDRQRLSHHVIGDAPYAARSIAARPTAQRGEGLLPQRASRA